MKIGDMLVSNTGHVGLIVDRELLYPRSPYSPVRNYIVMWNENAPHYCRVEKGVSKIDAFAVKPVQSQSKL
mgnify:CR=1 FL=1